MILLIIIGILLLVVSILSTTKILKEGKSILIKRLTANGWWLIGINLAILGLYTLQYQLNNKEIEENKRLSINEQDKRDAKLRQVYDSSLMEMKESYDKSNNETVSIISDALGKYGFKLDATNKELVGITKNEIFKVRLEVSKLQKSILSEEEYKQYLKVYDYLYDGFLKTAFPGGYKLYGTIKDKLVDPGNYRNDNYTFDVLGTIKIINNDLIVDLVVNKIEIPNLFINEFNRIKNRFKNYEIGVPYALDINMGIGTWDVGIIVLDDNPENPAYILGLGRFTRSSR